MPKLMEKADWMRTVENVSRADSVWSDIVDAPCGVVTLSLPTPGVYQVIMIKIDEDSQAMSQNKGY